MAKLAGVLQRQGVTKGDRVLIYMPMIPQVTCHTRHTFPHWYRRGADAPENAGARP